MIKLSPVFTLTLVKDCQGKMFLAFLKTIWLDLADHYAIENFDQKN